MQDTRWLETYERERHSKQSDWQSNWQSSKYDFTDPHVREEYVPEENCSVGGCMSALRKLWKGYKAGQSGERSYFAWKIRKIQSSLGLELSTFPETEGMDEEQESEGMMDDEEQQESDGEWNLNPSTEEWSEEDKRLLKEELEAEKEDDW